MTVGNTEKFSGRVEEYDRYRERYDAGLMLPLLRTWCGLTAEWTIADVGAGTGMLADVFLENGNRVLAVEPNGEMRRTCERLHAGEERLRMVNGTAEATTLDAGCVEMVAVGRALHWFDLEGALKEFRRVLKPDGWVMAAVLGRAEEGSPANDAYERLLRTVTEGERSSHAGYGVYRVLEGHCLAGTYHEREFQGEAKLTWEGLRGRTQSMSHAPLEGEERYAEFQRGLRDVFERFAVDGVFPLRVRCVVCAGRL